MTWIKENWPILAIENCYCGTTRRHPSSSCQTRLATVCSHRENEPTPPPFGSRSAETATTSATSSSLRRLDLSPAVIHVPVRDPPDPRALLAPRGGIWRNPNPFSYFHTFTLPQFHIFTFPTATQSTDRRRGRSRLPRGGDFSNPDISAPFGMRCATGTKYPPAAGRPRSGCPSRGAPAFITKSSGNILYTRF